MVDLDALVEEMVDRCDVGDPTDDGTRLIRVGPLTRAPGIELVESSPLAGRPLGWVAPATCRAVGVVARGRAWVAADHGRAGWPTGDGPPLDGGVSVAVVVARDGTVAGRVRRAGEAPIAEPPEGGLLFDCLRRCLGLPTAPPPPDAGMHLHLSLWLDAIRADIEGADRPPSWPEVLARHPAAVSVANHGLDQSIETAIVATGLVAGTVDWEDFRRRTAAGPLAGLLAPSHLAAWMDAGMFARWTVAGLPDPDDLLRRIRTRVDRTAAHRLCRVVAACR